MYSKSAKGNYELTLNIDKHFKLYSTNSVCNVVFFYLFSWKGLLINLFSK